MTDMFHHLRRTVSRVWSSWFSRQPAAPLTRSEKKRRRKELIRQRGVRL